MNTPNDIRWLLFATVPVQGHINLATPITRGILWLCRRLAEAGRRRMFNRAPENQVQTVRRRAAELGGDRGPLRSFTSRKEIAMFLNHQHVRRLR
jgi:hypothetical protein